MRVEADDNSRSAMPMACLRLAASAALVLALLLLSVGEVMGASGEVVTLPVPERTIYPGETITADRLSQRDFRNRGAVLSRFAVQPSDVVGRRVRRTLVARRPIPLGALQRAHVVTRGDRVAVFFAVGALRVSGYAEPLEDGVVGDRIKLRNPDTRVIMHGVILPDGTVQVH